MSRPTRRTSKSTATIWRKGAPNEYGESSYEDPFTVSCTFDFGSKNTYRDSKGVEFSPESVCWYDYDGSNPVPSEGDYIAKGTSVDLAPVEDAKPIRMVRRHDCGLLGQNDDIEIAT